MTTTANSSGYELKPKSLCLNPQTLMREFINMQWTEEDIVHYFVTLDYQEHRVRKAYQHLTHK